MTMKGVRAAPMTKSTSGNTGSWLYREERLRISTAGTACWSLMIQVNEILFGRLVQEAAPWQDAREVAVCFGCN